MGFIESIRLAFSALSANKMRSLLTMLGIIIGISAVITITTIGNSIQQTLSNTFNQFGMNYFYIMLTQKYYEETEEEDEDSYTMTDEDLMTDEMFEELFEKYPDMYQLAMNDYYDSCEVVNHNNEYVKASINGATDGYFIQGKIDIIKGRNLTTRDNSEMKHAIVISDIFERQYFPEGADPLGETISFTMSSGETQDFTVVGVYEYSEAKMGKFEPGTKEMDKVTPVYIPLNTSKALKGEENSGYYYAIVMWNTEYESLEAEQNLRDFFDEKYEHNKYWEIYIENEDSIVKMIDTVINVITIAISVIAAISLIVGGVGVMNIMLVSIVERTREIGIRKALGAQNSAIRLQFVVESIIICLIGGIIGIVIGVLNGVLIGQIAKYFVNSMYADLQNIITISVSPSISAIFIAVIFSMLTGIFFGYYPANKAAKMNPIDALRYE
ncbi:MAG: ABC transporter permease [Oscillospiraceae bacterium]